MSRATPRTSGYRTFADQLRDWPDDRLAQLLVHRPDLATPPPQDVAQLASRATSRSSLSRAIDQLTTVELAVLDALVVAGQATTAELAGLVHADPDAVAAAVTRVVDLGLAWESPQGWRALSGVADGLTGGAAPGVSGLRPCSPEPAAASEIRTLLDQLTPAARVLLEHVDAHGGEGTTASARHTLRPEDATSPAEELLSRRLLVPRGPGVVVLPGEVGLVLRGGRTTVSPLEAEPELLTTSRDQTRIDATAAGAAFETVRRLELLLDHWGSHPPAVLRSGGLGVRDLKATATHLHVDEAVAALLIEVAAAAGLLATMSLADGSTAWVPTDAFDLWASKDVAERWAVAVRAWLESPRVPSLVGSRPPARTSVPGAERAAKTWNALDPDLISPGQVESRAMALSALAELAEGEVLAAGTGLPSLVARIAWRRPRRPRSRAEQVAWAVDEAAVLGVTGLGGLASFSRALLREDDRAAAVALAALVPAPVEHVLIQADLTAVAPGPLATPLARTLQLLADVESRGGATVYRFTAASVRRALDNGWSATEIHDFLAEVSKTPVPQPLTYLVDDAARTFGSIRLGYAEAFVRADDEAALTELLHHPRAAECGLRRLAPTVLISSTPLDELVVLLREMGAAPVLESADGTVRVARPDVLRVRTPRDQRRPPVRQAHESARLAQVIAAVRAGDLASTQQPTRTGQPLSPQGSLVALREAIEVGRPVLIDYVDNHGTRSSRVVQPVRVEGGWLTAHDRRSQDTRTFAVHRITSVNAVEDPA